MIGKGRVASFKELRCEGTKPEPEAVRIIFVHGLAGNRTTTLRRSQKDWLRELNSTTNSRISIFGFDAAELLTGGTERLVLLADELHKNVLQLRGTEKLIFIGHGLAGWVIQENLSRTSAADIAWRTKGVLFLGLPSYKDQADWDKSSQNFLDLYTKTSSLRCTLKLSRLKDVQANFESLKKSSYGPKVDYVPVSGGNAASDSAAEAPHGEKLHLVGRSTTFPARSGGSDSSLSETIAQELSLPNVKLDDSTYLRAISFYNEAVAYEKSEPNFNTKTGQAVANPTSSRDSQFSSQSIAVSGSESSRSSRHFGRGSSMSFLEDPPSQEENSNNIENKFKNENEIIERQTTAVNEVVRFAALYLQSGELRKARALYETAKAEIAKEGIPRDSSVTGSIDIIDSEIAVMELLGGHIKDAEKIFIEVEPRLRSKFGDHKRTWEVARWLAVSYDMQGQYGKARQKLEEVLESKDIPSPEPYTEAAKVILLTKSSLALVIGHLGDYKEAISLSQAVLRHAVEANRKRVTEAVDHKESASLGRMLAAVQYDNANILACVGQLNEASSTNDEAMRGMENFYGDKYVTTLDCWSLKAQLLALQGRIDDAEELCQKTLKAMRREIGKEHPSALRTLGILVFICRKRARLVDALQTAKYLVERNQSSRDVGLRHPQTIRSMALLADVYLARGQLEQAFHDQKAVVELSQQVLGPYHPATLSYKSDLANIYCSHEYWNIACTILREVFLRQYKIYLSMSGALDKSDVGGRLLAAAGPVIDLKTWGDELRNILHSLDSDTQTCKKIYLPLVTTMHRLAVSERERECGNLELARELLTRVQKYRQHRLHGDNDDTLASQLDLALIDRKEDHINTAAECLELVATVREGVLGPDHPNTLTARHELMLTKLQLESEMPDEDIAHEQEEILQLRIRVLGKGHPDTIRSRIDLSNVFHSMGRLEDAESLQLDALKSQIDLYPPPIFIDKEKRYYEAALKAVELMPIVETNRSDADMSHLSIETNEPTPPPKSPNRTCHPRVISSLAALASIYTDKGDYEKAVTLQEAVVSQYKLLHPEPDHPTTLDSITILAQIYQALNNPSAAISLCKTILSLAPRLSLRYFDTQSLLGSLYFSTSDLAAAEAIQSQAYKQQKTRYKSDRDDPEALVIAIYNLALTKKELKRTEEAIGLLREALRVGAEGEGGLGLENARMLEVWDTLDEWLREGEGEGIVESGAADEE